MGEIRMIRYNVTSGSIPQERQPMDKAPGGPETGKITATL